MLPVILLESILTKYSSDSIFHLSLLEALSALLFSLFFLSFRLLILSCVLAMYSAHPHP
jgi:hypothetical protein